MPHSIVEYSHSVEKQIDPEILLATVHQTISKSPLFGVNDVSTRSMRYTHYRLGSKKAGFIHVTVRLFQGRSDRDKAELTRQIGEAVEAMGLIDTQISCECVDIHLPSIYRSKV
ncbi:MAG: 5-carboxymethyl-2-hydroxymuconate isomerase [Gammaproteobacteria bacterium]|nr:MAG: 5-carboxymethyl-2-hydroxymuconate isomerase [Gammaproteobacteria bacterium]